MKFPLSLPFSWLPETHLAQIAESISKRLGADPLIFIDSIESNMDALRQVNAMDISKITVLGKKQPKNDWAEKA